MSNESSMERTLKNGAKFLGILILAISVYLSYDGFDQQVTGGNTAYSTLAKLIGLVIAITICVIQFIFSSRYEQLNTTLKGAGLVSYAYSIWTNYLGAKHLLGMDEMTAWATAFFMDIVPEPMIAWSLGDALKGDVLGNIGKWFTGYQPRQSQQYQSSTQNQSNQSRNNNQNNQQRRPDGGGHGNQESQAARNERLQELVRSHNLGQSGKNGHSKEKPKIGRFE